MSIKLELPEENEIVLNAFGEALKKIAFECGYVAPLSVPANVVEIEAGCDIGPGTAVAIKDGVVKASQQCFTEEDETVTPPVVAETVTPPVVAETVTPPTASNGVELDDDGFPWDKRIHASTKTKTTKGLWKAQRKPQKMTADEWKVFVATVEAELREAMAGVTTQALPDAAATFAATETVAPPVTTETVAPPVTETVAPPVTETVAPPVTTETVAADTGEVKTFSDLMNYITQNNAKVTSDVVKAICAEQGIQSVTLLHSARADLIPAVYASVKQVVDNG